MILTKRRKKTTNLEAVNQGDVINKAYLYEKLFSKRRSLIFITKRLQRIEITIQQIFCSRNFNSEICEKTTTQKINDKILIDKFEHADEVLKNFLFATRSRGDLEENR